MSRLRRLVLSDRYFFVTCNLLRGSLFLSENEFSLLARVISWRRKVHGFLLAAWVLLPDHWHAIIYPQHPLTISEAMEAIKVSATRRLNPGRQTLGPLFQPRFFDRALSWAGSGAMPWHLDNGTESVLFLTDAGDKPVRIGFKVWANGAIYYLGRLKLSPHETRAIDLRKLRDAGKPDFKGNKIPTGASDGSVLWSRLDNVPVTGRLHITNRGAGRDFFMNCDPCDCGDIYTGTDVSGPSTLVAGQQGSFVATEWFEDCNGSEYPNQTGCSLGFRAVIPSQPSGPPDWLPPSLPGPPRSKLTSSEMKSARAGAKRKEDCASVKAMLNLTEAGS